MNSERSKWMDAIAGTLAMMITGAMVFIVVAPYFGFTPKTEDPTLLTQNQAVLGNMFIAIVSFFFGASVGNRKKDETIAALSTPTKDTP